MAASPGRRGPARGGEGRQGRRPGSGGRRRAAHSGRAGARARRTVPGAAARGGDLSAAKRAPQFVGAAPPLGGGGGRRLQGGGPCGAGKRPPSARPGDCGRRAPGRRALRSAPAAAAARRAPRARLPRGAPRADARARGRPRRAIAPLLPPSALPEGGCARTAAAEARPEVRAAPRRRDPPEGRAAGAPCRRGCTLGSWSGQGRGDGAAAAERPQPGPRGAGSPLPGGVAGRLSVHPSPPLSPVLRSEAGGEDAPSPARLSPLCLAFQAHRDRLEPRGAGLRAWTESCAPRRAQPYGGKRLSARPLSPARASF